MLLAVACAPEPAPEPIVVDPSAPFAEIRSCPAGDRDWVRARSTARREQRIEQLLALAIELGATCEGAWQPYWLQARLQLDLKQRESAREAALTAFRRADAAQDDTGRAWSGSRLAYLDLTDGQLESARDFAERAVAAAAAADRGDLVGQAANALGTIRTAQGDLPGAREAYRRAGAGLRATGNERQARRVEQNLAILTLRLGDAFGAERVFVELHAEALADGDGYLPPRIAIELGHLYRRLRRYDDAESWYRRVGEEGGELAALAALGLGLVALERDEHDRALERFRDAEAQSPKRFDQLLARIYAAEVELRAGRADEALRRIEPSIAEAEELGVLDPSWIARWIEGLAHAALGDAQAARASLERAVATLEEQRASVRASGGGLRYLRGRSDPYVDLARVNAADPAAAFDVVARTHARALDEHGALPTLAEVEATLDADEALLDFAVGERGGLLLVVRPDGTTAIEIPGWRTLREPLAGYRNALRRPLLSAEARLDPMADLARSAAAGERLSEALLAGALPALDGVRRLYVIPDGELALLPFAALPLAKGWLADRFEVATLPLAGRLPDRRGRRAPALLLGEPLADAGGQWPALARSGAELDAIAAIYGERNVTSLRGDALTAASVMAARHERFATVHFATHAEASSVDPRRCAVRLSHGEPLGIDAIASIDWSGDLVVLSACQSGEGEVVPGEGVVGLTWAFLHSGAGAVVASLWRVDDAAAGELMVAFHDELEGSVDPATALSRAQRSVRQRRPHPAYWAPFVLTLRPVR